MINFYMLDLKQKSKSQQPQLNSNNPDKTSSNSNMAQTLVSIDISNPEAYLAENFVIDPQIESRSFKGADGKVNAYNTGTLLYKCIDEESGQEVLRPPCFVMDGDSFGLQLANEQKETTPAPQVPGMVSIQAKPNANKRDKYQVAVYITQKPVRREWSEVETNIIEFFSTVLPNILADRLSANLTLLQQAMPNIVTDAQATFQEQMQTSEAQQKYPTQEAQMQLLAQIAKAKIKSKVSKKVYRKKKPKKEGETVNYLDPEAQYDPTKKPMFYIPCQHFVSKKTQQQVFITKFYKMVEGVSELEWPELTYEEALELGAYNVTVATRFDGLYFGASISPQMKVAECVFNKPVKFGLGHTGRIVRARGPIKKNTRLVKSVPVTSDTTQTQLPGSGSTTPIALNPPTESQFGIPSGGFNMSQVQGMTGFQVTPTE